MIALLLVISCQLTSILLDTTKPDGVVFVAGGAGSVVNLPGMIRWALKQKSIGHEVREVNWSHGPGRVVRDIQDIRHLVDKSNDLAQQIREYQAVHPDRPIYLMGRSTGAMIVLQASEQLQPGSIERIILLSPAVSAEYDLTAALRSTRQDIVSFRSSLDVAVLDWGTSLIGTADRYYTKSAGLNGFVMPTTDQGVETDYQRVKQIAWKPSKMIYGHFGGHLGNGMPLFLLFEVTPYLR